MLEERTGIPVLGVVPYFHLDLDEEDSLTERFQKKQSRGLVDVAVIRLPRISNFTDIAPLEACEEAGVRYVSSPAEFGEPDAVILPGSKNTIQDLLWMRQNGLEAKILRYASEGWPCIRHLRRISDAGGRSIRSGGRGAERHSQRNGTAPGADDIYRREKENKSTGTFPGASGNTEGLPSGREFEGYEIHMGESSFLQEEDLRKVPGPDPL